MKDPVDYITENMSKTDFQIFLKSLLKDLDENKSEWENVDLERFLQAMINWSDSASGYYRNFNLKVDHKVASWRIFADILAAARVYE